MGAVSFPAFKLTLALLERPLIAESLAEILAESLFDSRTALSWSLSIKWSFRDPPRGLFDLLGLSLAQLPTLVSFEVVLPARFVATIFARKLKLILTPSRYRQVSFAGSTFPLRYLPFQTDFSPLVASLLGEVIAPQLAIRASPGCFDISLLPLKI